MDEKPRRWFRFAFSLRTLLVLVTVLGIAIAWITSQQRQSLHEMQVAEELRQQGLDSVTIGGPNDSWELLSLGKPQGTLRDWSRWIRGQRILWINGKLIDSLKPLAELSSLKALVVDASKDGDLTPLAKLSNLEVLWIDRTPILDLSPISHLTNLEGLYCNYTQISDLGPLANLPQLRTLYLNHTPVSDLAPLAKMPQLQTLSLIGTQVRDLTPLAGCQELQSLRLAETPVKDISPLLNLKNLQELDLRDTDVSGEQVAALQKLLPNCQIDVQKTQPDP